MTPRQEKFCVEYLIDLNATQAAIRAGYSKRTAEALASRLLRNVNIRSRIKELQDKVFEYGMMSATCKSPDHGRWHPQSDPTGAARCFQSWTPR